MKFPLPDILPPSPLPYAGYEAGHKQSPLARFIAYFAWRGCYARRDISKYSQLIIWKRG